MVEMSLSLFEVFSVDPKGSFSFIPLIWKSTMEYGVIGSTTGFGPVSRSSSLFALTKLQYNVWIDRQRELCHKGIH